MPTIRVALWAGFICLGMTITVPAQAQSCEAWTARVISVQGSVRIQRPAATGLLAARLDDLLCVGDQVVVDAFSRAALVLRDETVVRLDANTSVTLQPPQDQKRSWLEVLKGILHIVSRDPRALSIVTPFANAGIEGTEFLVEVTETQAAVTVFEGAVSVVGRAGSATASSGQQVVATAAQVTAAAVTVRPPNAVTWALYYPPVLGGAPLPAADAAAPAGADTRFFTGRAAARLSVGRVAEARSDLDQSLRLAPDNAQALALQSIIATTQNDSARALELATRARERDPASAAALLSYSYVQQAQFDIPGALETLKVAAEQNPSDALVRARLSELWLAVGDVDRAVDAAEQAVALNANVALSQSVLGFARLARADVAEARTAFQKAVALDSAAPLPRLGLGLALIRDGELAAGRAEIENAVILDPGSAVIRSYMGKAYYEEKRDTLAESQLAIAKELDALDPTPWFYDAIRKQTINQPIDALQDLGKSTELNDNRAVYRSRLLLDDDAAARNANVSAIYNELGFEALAITQATEALADNFGNSSAHRLLANSYARLPRNDISRVSESFQAQIRQPLTAPPVDLLDSSDNLGILRDTGPSRSGVNEYNSLFNRDQLRIDFDGFAGSRDTIGDQFVASGLSGSVGYAFGQLHYETEGFFDNSDAERNVYDAFLQKGLSADTSLQLDLRHSDFELGYTFYEFDEFNAFPVKIDEKSDVARFNGRHATSAAGDWIWTVAYESRQRDVDYPPLGILVTRTEADTYVGEVQRLDRFGGLQIISGAGYIDADQEFPIEQVTLPVYNANAYVYSQWRSEALSLDVIGGLSFDKFKQEYCCGLGNVDRDQLNPKIGVVWSPLDGTTLRAAAFTSVRHPFIAQQTLEPTQVAGFNQFFTGLEQFYGDPEGTVSRRTAVAVDQAVSDSIFAGVEGALRQLDVPSIILQGDQSWREKTARAYLYKTFAAGETAGLLSNWNAALSLTAEYEDLSRPWNFTGAEGILDLETTRVPIGLALYGPGGLSLRVVTGYVEQDGLFSIDVGLPVVPKDDDAWITDVLLEYRLPRRFGIISVGARNITDAELDVVETDPLSPRVAARRIVSATLNLTF